MFSKEFEQACRALAYLMAFGVLVVAKLSLINELGIVTLLLMMPLVLVTIYFLATDEPSY